MYRILTGVIFCLISSILFATRYIAPALNTKVSVGSNFPIFLDFIGDELKIASFIALLIGVSYIILGEMELKKGIK